MQRLLRIIPVAGAMARRVSRILARPQSRRVHGPLLRFAVVLSVLTEETAASGHHRAPAHPVQLDTTAGAWAASFTGATGARTAPSAVARIYQAPQVGQVIFVCQSAPADRCSDGPTDASRSWVQIERLISETVGVRPFFPRRFRIGGIVFLVSRSLRRPLLGVRDALLVVRDG